MLGRAGFEVVAEARDGTEAVELARTCTPDLALLDVRMPGMDGIEAARAMLEERPIPIVMITAYSQRDVVARAVEAGVFGYLVKPFREADLVPAIETARARHAELAGGAGRVRLAARRPGGPQGDRAGEGPSDGARRPQRGRGVRADARGRAAHRETLRDIAEAVSETYAPR